MKISVIGGGNWGTTIAKLVAENVLQGNGFSRDVVLWMYEEKCNGSTLTEYINANHENPKYLPGVKLPENILARSDYDLSDRDILIFCVPHQFLDILKKIKIKSSAIGINLGKGMISKDHKLLTPSEHIGDMLNIECNCLMGANIATEVAEGKLSDSTLGVLNQKNCALLKKVFQSSYFKVETVSYDKSIEISSALKNIVSIAVGICDGMEWGKNTHAVVCRQGLLEMKALCSIMKATLEICSSACIGDLMVSCLCGRNYKCGLAMGKDGISVDDYEKTMNGQKLQGPGTASTVVSWLEKQKYGKREFPIIFAVDDICRGRSKPEALLSILRENL